VETALPLARRTAALNPAAAWRLALGALVALSVAVRLALAWRHPTPNYFPDEYLYAALSRGLGSVRGEWAGFPALLQPLLTAPLWHLGSIETGYRAVQAFNAVAMSLAAVPVWLLARRLGVTRGLALGCAALAVALPDLMYASWIVAEPVTYPLVLGAAAAIVFAVERPTRRAQALALVLCALAALARIQFVVLPLVYVVATLAHDGRRAPRRHPALFALYGLALLGALALGPARLLGYYSGVLAASISPEATARAVGRNLLVLAYAGGFVIVPGAVLGLLRAPRSFRAVTVLLTLLLLAQASLLGDVNIAQERYLFYVLPLLAIAFALEARRGRVHALLCAGMVALAATIPLAGWAAADGKTHSAVLFGVFKLGLLTGDAGSGALIVGAVAGALALAAIVLPKPVTLGLAVVAAAAIGLAAGSFDRDNSVNVRSGFVAPDPAWVDHAHIGRTAFLLGPETPNTSTDQLMFWNRSVDRMLALDGARAPDRFAMAPVQPARDGSLGVRTALLVDGYGSTIRLADARVVGSFGTWTLVQPHGEAKLALQVTGRYGDGWLAPRGRITVWQHARSIAFTLTAPAKLTMTFGTRRVALEPNVPKRVVIPIRSVPFAITYAASSNGWVGTRPVSAQASVPVLNP
jgi:hypothetical protein